MTTQLNFFACQITSTADAIRALTPTENDTDPVEFGQRTEIAREWLLSLYGSVAKMPLDERRACLEAATQAETKLNELSNVIYIREEEDAEPSGKEDFVGTCQYDLQTFIKELETSLD